MEPADAQQVCDLIRSSYEELWKKAFSGTAASPARINPVVPDDDSVYSGHASGYFVTKDEILIVVEEGNLTDHDILDQTVWNIWKIELIHEMAHEVQGKLKLSHSPRGTHLFDTFGRLYVGPGHGQDFFEAIIHLSQFFQESAEDLCQILKSY